MKIFYIWLNNPLTLRNLFLALLALPVLFFVSCTKDATVNIAPVADAGPARTIEFPDTVHLAGSGHDVDGSIVGYLWSQLAGPVESSILNPADSGATVSFSQTGTYRFQLMVVDNSGATGLDTVSVLVKSKPIDTLSLQPSNNPSAVMIWGNLNGLDESWAKSPETGAAAWTSGAPVWERSAFKFDLTSIPANATVLSATLSLYSEAIPLNGNLIDANYGDNSMLIKQVITDWDPNATNFTHQPMTTSDNQVLVPSTTQSRLDISADVSAIVSKMVTTQTNYGFMIQLQNEVYYASRLFYSSFADDASKHPKLVVVYKN